jgi:hypothetical protein
MQKLRTLRHPYILTYLDGTDVEDSLLLVTERCTPLETWLEGVNTSGSSEEEKQATIQELLWGFRCILNALQV